MAHTQSELQVITFAKNLCSYVMTIAQKSPKQFRFSLVGRMQGYVLDIVEELYYACDEEKSGEQITPPRPLTFRDFSLFGRLAGFFPFEAGVTAGLCMPNDTSLH